MKRILTILFLLIGFIAQAQLRPVNTIPTQKSTGLFEQGWNRADSAHISAVRDTFSARYPGSRIMRRNLSDTAEWFFTGQRWKRLLTEGEAGAVNARRSVTKVTLDTLQLVNDTSLNVATGRKFGYELDTTGRRAYYEDKYVIGATYPQIRKLRIPDTNYVFRVNVGGVVADYKYDPSDASTTDDTVMTIVSTAGYRYKRYILDGVFDPKWWDARAGTDGFDATFSVQAALRAVSKYSSGTGYTNGQQATIRLFGTYRFNPSTFVYPNIACTFSIKGSVTILDTWTLPAHWNIEGVGMSTYYEVFGQGNFSSITTDFVNATATPKAALALVFGTQIIRNISINSHVGVGVHLNGTASLPASLSTLENVFVNCNGYTGGGDQIGIRVSDWFWAKFLYCSANVEQAAFPGKPGSTVLIEGKTVVGDGNFCYLLDFQHLITQGRPVRIKSAGVGLPGVNVPIFNVTFSNCTFENVQFDPSVIDINSTDIGVSNVKFDYCATADCPNGTYLIRNTGHSTVGVSVNNPYDLYLYTGDPIEAFTVNGVGRRYPIAPTSWTDNIMNQGQIDVKNSNRGWRPPWDLIRFQDGGGQIVKVASNMKLAISGNFIGPVAGWNGDTVACKMPPSPPNFTQINFKNYNQAYKKGQKVVFGCWLKVDTITPATSATQLMAYFDNPGYTFKTTGTKEYIDDSYQQKAKDWQFVSSVGVIDTANGTTQVLHVGIRNNGTYDTVYISNPFVLLVDSTFSDAEVMSWAKEYKGGTFGAPDSAYALRDDVPTYIGDSTRFLRGVLQRNIAGVWTNVGGGGGSAPTGTSGSVAFYGVATTLSQKNTDFFYDSTNVRLGIGSNSPAGRLSIHGNGATNPNFINMVDNGSSGVTYSFQNRFGGTAGTFSLVNIGSGSSVWTTTNSGNFGINNNNPAFRLDVTGAIHSTGDATLDGNITGNNDNIVWTPLGSDVGIVKQAGFVAFNGVSNGNAWSIKRSSTGDITGASTYTEILTLDASNNLGLGTTTPGEKLEVNGKIIAQADSTSTATGGFLYKEAGTNKFKITGAPSGGISTLNTLTAGTQTFATGTSGTDFNISSATSTHTFNIPSASASNRGLVTTGSQTFAGLKTFNDGIVSKYQLTPAFQINGNTSGGSLGISGVGIYAAPFTFNDAGATRTDGNGQFAHVIGLPTITATNTVTYSGVVASLYLQGAPIASTGMTINQPFAIASNDNNFLQGLVLGISENNSSVSLGAPSFMMYDGTGGHTFTLPALSRNKGKVYFIKNAGSGALSVARAGSDNIWDTSSVTSISIAAGAARIIIGGSGFWYCQ